MTEPRHGLPEGFGDAANLDRSEQAARFLDLTRRHSDLSTDDVDLVAALAAADLDGDGKPDVIAATDDGYPDMALDQPLGIMSAFTIGDDDDVFGDGNGFGAGMGLAEDDPDNPFD